MTTQIFEIAQGTVTGREHRREGRNNQDASHVSRTVHTLAAIVCDGCSSAPHSEVGAQLASRFLTQHLTTLATANPYLTPDALLAHARAHLHQPSVADDQQKRNAPDHVVYVMSAELNVVEWAAPRMNRVRERADDGERNKECQRRQKLPFASRFA